MSAPLKKHPYGNWKVKSKFGDLMFRCAEKRALWYIAKGLAVQVDSTTIQLIFDAKGPGHAGEAFYLEDKRNQCVVCGIEERLSKHHIVPKWYRRYFPEDLKAHRSYDVLVLCVECHEKYEKIADIFRQELAVEYNSPLPGPRQTDKIICDVVKAAKTLLIYRKQMPPSRIEFLLNIIQGYYKRNITNDDIEAASRLDPVITPVDPTLTHAKIVVEQVDIYDFVKRWRQHFITTMQPQFLPKGWSVEGGFRKNEEKKVCNLRTS